jgi:hypothetical protein
MTAVLPRSPGRHRAPESGDEPRWASPTEFRAARAGRHAAPERSGRHAADSERAADGDVFDWLGFAPIAG